MKGNFNIYEYVKGIHFEQFLQNIFSKIRLLIIINMSSKSNKAVNLYNFFL